MNSRNSSVTNCNQVLLISPTRTLLMFGRTLLMFGRTLIMFGQTQKSIFRENFPGDLFYFVSALLSIIGRSIPARKKCWLALHQMYRLIPFRSRDQVTLVIHFTTGLRYHYYRLTSLEYYRIAGGCITMSLFCYGHYRLNLQKTW